MLAKDMFALNDVDSKIQDLIVQLQELIDKRIDLASENCPLSRKTKAARDSRKIDFSSIDLTIDESDYGLSMTRFRSK